MSERNTYCEPSPSWHHAAKRESDEPLGLKAVCKFCGVEIHRAHLKSSWWWDNIPLSALPAGTDPGTDA